MIYMYTGDPFYHTYIFILEYYYIYYIIIIIYYLRIHFYLFKRFPIHTCI